ncbi:sigma-70 family RNA polymerase sigma factor [Paenibacillus terrigena]|uniref:sigma-70 family RNA polymerase sigma factor n=1 Tax=Paenibacillus terrigena TaxID=369333 RepID=UPI0028D7B3BB|nr:sigma-70 family RNA polymerase sigma factor [Paenibacillus terrigena]
MTGTEVARNDRVSKRDMEAFEDLINKYANAVYGIAYSKVGDFHTAQDIAQEVFVKAYRKCSSLREPDKMGSWLYTVTTRECMDWFRLSKQSRACGLTEDVDLPQLETTEDQLLKKELRHEIWDALNTLSEVNRTVTILYYIDEYKIREISDLLALSVDAVESRLRRSRKLLKKEMLRIVSDNLNANKLNDAFKKKVFQDERMSETKFHRVSMGKSDFNDIDMFGTQFYNVNLQDSRFDNINMSKTFFHDINMQHVKFEEIGLWDIEVCNSAMGGANFHHIKQEGKGNRFDSCELQGTTFVQCNLANVDIQDCDITGMKINGIPIEELLKHYKGEI